MKENIKVGAFRITKNEIDKFNLIIDDERTSMSLNYSLLDSSYNVRCIMEMADSKLSYPDKSLGKLVEVFELANKSIKEKVIFSLNNQDTEYLIKGEYNVVIKVFEDLPVHQYAVLDALPIPTSLLTIYVYFYNPIHETVKFQSNINKYFDGFSHLGFFLTDLNEMKRVISEKYGDVELDLINEFTTTDLIDTLFEEEIIIITWGINPYTYPIYSTDNVEIMEPLLGQKFHQEGIFNIKENLTELSLIPGHELKNWPNFLNEDWKKFPLYGKGKKTHLIPYTLKDDENETVLASFLIYKEEGFVEESVPLLNVNLLYS